MSTGEGMGRDQLLEVLLWRELRAPDATAATRLRVIEALLDSRGKGAGKVERGDLDEEIDRLVGGLVEHARTAPCQQCGHPPGMG